MRARTAVWQGIVVGRHNYGDADLIVELLTASQGRMRFFAPYARQSRRRFGGSCQIFAEIKAQGRETNTLWRLHGAELMIPRSAIGLHWQRLQRASHFVEIARRLTPEHQAAPQLYQALTEALDALALGCTSEAVCFYPRLLAAYGIWPDMQYCTTCGCRDVLVAVLLATTGGTQCQCCARRSSVAGAIVMSDEVARVLAGATCDNEKIAIDTEKVVVAWVEAQLGKPLKSARWMTGAKVQPVQ